MLQDSHQQYRDEILASIKKIQDRTLISRPDEDNTEFIPTGTMILKISNLFMDTFMDRSRVEYFLWFLGLLCIVPYMTLDEYRVKQHIIM